MIDTKKIGEYVANTRRAQGITQLELSQACNVGRRFIVELENGKPTIRTDKLLHVLDVLGIGVSLSAPKGV